MLVVFASDWARYFVAIGKSDEFLENSRSVDLMLLEISKMLICRWKE